jgi:hypothetical protein
MGPHAWAKEGTSMNPAKTSRKNIIKNAVFLTKAGPHHGSSELDTKYMLLF